MIRRLLDSAVRLVRDHHGAVAVEMAMTIPVITALLLTGVEVTRYVLLNQKVERASATMADLVSQAESLNQAGLNTLFDAASFAVDPFDLPDHGRLIVSSISATSGNPPRVNWQRGFGAGSGSSTFGVEGGNAILPSGFQVRDGESIIVGEAFFDFTPIFAGDVLGDTTLHAYSVLRPRFGPLTSIN